MKKIIAFGLSLVLFCGSCFVPAIQSNAEEMNQFVVQEETNETGEGTESDDLESVDEDLVDEAGKQMENIENPDENSMNAETLNESDEYVPSVTYTTHVQRIGWQDPVRDGQMAGTSGQSLRMEGIIINLENVPEGKGSIEYCAHVQRIGWQPYVNAGEMAGTSGRSLRVEAFKLRLTGELAESYDIYYRTHIQSYGWLGWAKNGAGSGSMGQSKRMEAVEIRIVKKGEAAPGDETNSYIYNRIAYEAHSQSYGWLGTVYDDKVGGVTGRSKRLEALKITLPDKEYEGDVEYRAFVQGIGWQNWVKNGEIAGTVGASKRIEALEVRLTGEIAEHYSVYYRVHMARVGWSGYAKDGATAGSTDLSKRIEAIQIKLVKNGESAPDTSGVTYIKGLTDTALYYRGMIQDIGDSGNVTSGNTLGKTGQSKRLENLTIYLDHSEENQPSGDILYTTHLSQVGWQSETGTGTVNGCTDGSYGIEAVKLSLTGELASYYDIYYRAHIEKYGWLGWAKNGQTAGSTGIGYRMEALQIQLVSKDASAPGANSNYYKDMKYRRYQNPSQYYQIKDKITLSGGGYNLSVGYEGIKVRKVIQRLGLGNGIGMGGAYYGTNVQNAVREFQKNNGLPQTGVVDYMTWARMGFNEVQWNSYGAYVSPIRVNENSSRADHIEAMISRAYDYLGNDYVIGASGAPGLGIDCSGLVMQALYAAGLDLETITPVTHAMPGHEYESRNMWNSSKFKHVSYGERKRGDLIFYQSSSGVVIHVAIYLGNDQVIEAWPNKVVVWPIKNGARSNIKGVVRPFV